MNIFTSLPTPPRPILVHESISHWTAELERAFAPHPEIIFRWRPYCEELLQEVTLASLVLLIVLPDDQSLDLIRQVKAKDRKTPLACIISQPASAWEWMARELGVDIIFPDTLEKERVAFSLQRCLGLSPAIARYSPAR